MEQELQIGNMIIDSNIIELTAEQQNEIDLLIENGKNLPSELEYALFHSISTYDLNILLDGLNMQKDLLSARMIKEILKLRLEKA